MSTPASLRRRSLYETGLENIVFSPVFALSGLDLPGAWKGRRGQCGEGGMVAKMGFVVDFSRFGQKFALFLQATRQFLPANRFCVGPIKSEALIG